MKFSIPFPPGLGGGGIISKLFEFYFNNWERKSKKEKKDWDKSWWNFIHLCTNIYLSIYLFRRTGTWYLVDHPSVDLAIQLATHIAAVQPGVTGPYGARPRQAFYLNLLVCFCEWLNFRLFELITKLLWHFWLSLFNGLLHDECFQKLQSYDKCRGWNSGIF